MNLVGKSYLTAEDFTPALTPEQLEQVQEVVNHALSLQVDADLAMVQITEFMVERYQGITPEMSKDEMYMHMALTLQGVADRLDMYARDVRNK